MINKNVSGTLGLDKQKKKKPLLMIPLFAPFMLRSLFASIRKKTEPYKLREVFLWMSEDPLYEQRILQM